MPEFNLNKTVSALKDLVFLGTFVIGIFSGLLTLLFTFGWPLLMEKLINDMQIATKDDVAAITRRIDQLSGDDHVLKTIPGHSYIKEPVTKGELVEMTLTAKRTERGESCVFLGGTPLFTDGRDIPFPGGELKVIKQFSKEQGRIQIAMTAPDVLEPGRVGVYLSLQYSCPFGHNGSMINVFEDTDMIFFKLDS